MSHHRLVKRPTFSDQKEIQGGSEKVRGKESPTKARVGEQWALLGPRVLGSIKNVSCGQKGLCLAYLCIGKRMNCSVPWICMSTVRISAPFLPADATLLEIPH